MSVGGTAAYEAERDVPALVRAAVVEAADLGFDCCVRPEIGRLLATLARGLPPRARVGETGTGIGAGLAWMIDAARSDTTFVSYEIDPARAAAAQRLLRPHSNVTVVCGDAAAIVEQGPFDLLVLDGGPGSGKAGDAPLDPRRALRPGGTLTIDDLTPTDRWPPMHDGSIDRVRLHWLGHPALRSTEIRVATDLAVLVCRYLPDRDLAP